MIILFGPAGSGKSTQGRTIADTYGWRWLSVGQVIRDTGQFDDIIKNGDLIDDATVVELMERQIAFADAEGMDIVLDGYPRNMEQAEILLKDDSSNFFGKIAGVVVLNVPKDELWRRLEERGRADDTKEAFEKRYKIYEQKTCSILPLIRGRNIPVVEVDGVGDFDEVTKRITKAISKMMPEMVKVMALDDPESIENDALEREKSYGE